MKKPITPLLPPMIVWDFCEDSQADTALVEWEHWLGGCNRPFGRQSFGLWLDGQLVAVAVSASTVNARCGGYRRQEVVELARLCAHPDHREADTRGIAPMHGPASMVDEILASDACVSYANAVRHRGDIYRFDGWTKVADVKGGTAGVNTGWTRPRKNYEAKSIWVWVLPAMPKRHDFPPVIAGNH